MSSCRILFLHETGGNLGVLIELEMYFAGANGSALVTGPTGPTSSHIFEIDRGTRLMFDGSG